MSAQILITISAGEWQKDEIFLSHLENVAKTANAVCAPSTEEDVEISILLTDDVMMRDLNQTYRGKDSPTNVLSFPGVREHSSDAPTVLGDIILSYETILRESTRDQKSFDDHLTHLLIHGILHLYGYDHETEENATEMESLEISILKEFGIGSPYAFMPQT